MHQFHLAPWRTYKALLLTAALAVPVIFYLARSSFDEALVSDRMFARRVVQAALAWSIGWFLVLFGDGSFGRIFLTSLRSYYVVLGIGFIALGLLAVFPIM